MAQRKAKATADEPPKEVATYSRAHWHEVKSASGRIVRVGGHVAEILTKSGTYTYIQQREKIGGT